MRKRVGTSISGKLLSWVLFRHTPGKKPFATFSFFGENSLMECKAFGEIALAARDLEQGDLVQIAGRVDDEGAFVVSALYLTRKASAGVPVTIVQLTDEEKARLKLEEEVRGREGLVKTAYGWRRKENCIVVLGRWIPKIEFVMDRLGPERATEELRELLRSSAISLVSMSRSQARTYTEWLDSKVNSILEEEMF